MCGRYTQTGEFAELKRRFGLAGGDPGVRPRWNQAPGQDAPVVAAGQGPRLAMMRWGLVPHWAEDAAVGYKTINARAETAPQRAAFKGPFRRSRCLVPADGFYEWPGGKADGRAPVRFTLAGGGLFAMAGLWDRWGEGDSPLHSFSILTTAANDLVAAVHQRMPAILAPEDEAAWLDPGLSDPGRLAAMLRPFPAGEMAAAPASARVNRPQNEGPGLLKPEPRQGALF